MNPHHRTGATLVGTPTLQMFFGLLLGAFCGFVFGWSRHPLLGVTGIFVGGFSGVVYAGLACLACGSALDLWIDALRSRRYLMFIAGLILWLLASASFVFGAFVLIRIAAN